MIDLRSDTVTKPSPEMMEAMMNANVGDDVFAEDITVNSLEEKVAAMFGKEAAIFCPSGTMANQIAIKILTKPLDEIICHKDSHIYKYELGGYAFHSGTSIKLLEGERGKITAQQVADNINDDYDWLTNTKLVVLENTSNRGGGSIYKFNEMQEISETCRNNDLNIHLDGARLFNAIVESDYETEAVGNLFDSVSICLSKGLGCPVGTVLTGSKTFIKKARKVRKAFGGGMRQAGFLAAAGIYALDNNVNRLKEDHNKIKTIAECLKKQSYIQEVIDPETNILIFKLKETIKGADFINKLAASNVKAIEFGPQMIRFVAHYDVKNEMMEKLLSVLKGIG